MKATRKWAGGIFAASLAMSGLAPDAIAQGNPNNAIQAQVQGVQATLDAMGPKLDAIGPKLDAIGPKLDTVNGKLDTAQGKLDAQASAAAANFQALQNSLTAISLKIDALAVPMGMVPFTAQAAGGLCDSGPSPSSNPQIVIEGTGSHLFVVNSILVKTAPQAFGEDDYTYFTVNSVQIDGTRFDTKTGNLLASDGGSGVQESADLMGMPVRLTGPSPLNVSPRTESPGGGNFPHQIVADATGTNDIRIGLFCRSDTHALSIETVRISGWKWSTDSVSVDYVPGQ